ncbi:MAG: poly(A) polymerase [Solirubrobacteraceae bacterium]|nr:poly(A) polymerase [Solirubrobacteraceae bacterium]
MIDVLREALAGERAWLVGGALRDRLLGRPTPDLDVAVDGDVRAAARRLGRGAGGASFELSDQFGAWRVVGRDRSWQVDFVPLAGGSLEADLAARDLTVNAMAEPLAGGDLVDPHGGRRDLEQRRLRMVSAQAFANDPLRTLRVARLATELGFDVEPDTARAVRHHAARLADVAQERVFAELRRLLTADEALRGLALADELGLVAVVLPELAALQGIEQSRYHHRDVHGHTLEVLEAVIELEREPAAVLGEELAGPVRALLAEPLADELTRGGALRFGALLHDAAKPQTRITLPDGRIGFPRHDEAGAELARRALTRLRASERLRAHVAALTRHHLRLGFLVHDMPLDRRAIYRYLLACEPVEADVTLLSVADRLATRGRKADEAIARHLELARQLLGEALARRADGPQAPLVRGDVLASELGIAPGPELGELLARIAEARFAGEVRTPEEALELARAARAGR